MGIKMMTANRSLREPPSESGKFVFERETNCRHGIDEIGSRIVVMSYVLWRVLCSVLRVACLLSSSQVRYFTVYCV